MKRTRAVLSIFLAVLIGAVGIAPAWLGSPRSGCNPRRPPPESRPRLAAMARAFLQWLDRRARLAFPVDPHRERRLERRLARRGRVDAGHCRAAGLPLRRRCGQNMLQAMCFDRTNGKLLWSHDVAKGIRQDAAQHLRVGVAGDRRQDRPSFFTATGIWCVSTWTATAAGGAMCRRTSGRSPSDGPSAAVPCSMRASSICKSCSATCP